MRAGGDGAVRIGCSGWSYRHWRDRVYPRGLPPRRWLEHYATLFDTVEVNATFYRLPSAAAVRGWVEATPASFLFALKASRFLTHQKRLTDMGEPVRRFYERIDPLSRARKLGPVLWQLPASFRRDDERLARMLDSLPPGRHCVEFRHASWFAEAVYALLRRRGVALVIADEPTRTFQTCELTADFTYLRFHGGGQDGNYSHRQLATWARRVEEWRAEVDVYVYFNNDWQAFAVENARWLRERLAS